MADKFSPSLLNFFKTTFDDFDTDGDGKLTKEDIAKMMRFGGENPTERKLEFHFNEFDADENDTVDFPEYLAVLSKTVANGGDRNRVVKSFQYLDKDGDGFLSEDDLRHTFEGKRIDEMMKYDHDRDGKLNYEEFAIWVRENKILGELFSGESSEADQAKAKKREMEN